MIHSLAMVDPSARVAASASVGPWSIVGPNVEIGEETEVRSHAIIRGPTTIGKRNTIYQFSSVGEDPSDKKYRGEATWLRMGDDNVVREGVTIHRGTVGGGKETRIGSRNLLMAYAHVAHDATIGNDCIFVNNAAVAGHVSVDDHAILGGYALVHQHCHIGTLSFCGLGAVVIRDVPAYVTVVGNPAHARGINDEGLRRRGHSDSTRMTLTRCFNLLYDEKMQLEERLEQIESIGAHSVLARTFLASLRRSTRGIIHAERTVGPGASIQS